MDVNAEEAVASVVGGETGKEIDEVAAEWAKRQHHSRDVLPLREAADDRIRSVARIARFKECTDDFDTLLDKDECAALLPAICRTLRHRMTSAQRVTLCGSSKSDW
jgi:hypothetical protein